MSKEDKMSKEEKRYGRNVDYFKKRVKYYFFEVFHMYDYELDLTEQNSDFAKATTYWYPIEDGQGKIEICYTKTWLNDIDTKLDEIDKTAFHEVCETILSELQQISRARFITEKDIPNAVHRVIRRFENIIFPMFKDKM